MTPTGSSVFRSVECRGAGPRPCRVRRGGCWARLMQPAYKPDGRQLRWFDLSADQPEDGLRVARDSLCSGDDEGTRPHDDQVTRCHIDARAVHVGAWRSVA